MGLFDKWGKKDKAAEKKADASAVYTFTVQKVYNIKEKGLVAVGVVCDAEMYTGDEVSILSRGGNVYTSEIETMENPKVGKMVKAEPGNDVAILLKDMTIEQVKPGDIVTNMTINKEVEDNKEVTNPRLKILLNEMKKKPSQGMMSLILEEVATQVTFITLAKVEKHEESGAEIMQFPMLMSPDKKPYYPVFTDWKEIELWKERPDAQVVTVDFDMCVDMVEKNKDVGGLAINPFSINYIMTRKGMDELKGQKKKIASGEYEEEKSKVEIKVGDPVNCPPEMEDAIRAYLLEQPAVKKAWLRLMHQGNDISYLVVLDCDANNKEIFEKVAEIAQPFLKEVGINVGPCDVEFGKKAVQGAVPFYMQ